MKMIRIITLVVLLLPGGVLRAPQVLARIMTGGTVGTPLSAFVREHGLEISLHVVSGPYFQGEALPVQVALINHSHTARWLGAGNSGDGLPLVGSSSLILRVPAEGTPAFVHETPASTRPPLPERLDPGERITAEYLIILGPIGHTDVVAETTFTPHGYGEKGFVWGKMITLFAHWPHVTLTVSPHVPLHRTLHLQRTHTGVKAIVPAELHPALYYIQYLECTITDKKKIPTFQPGPPTSWSPLLGREVTEPDCPGVVYLWHVAIAAPGYVLDYETY